jgi:4-cresol dehydrogenase (hydroxylating) flavoprotein subunit
MIVTMSHAEALAALSALLGDAHVDRSHATLGAANRATFATSSRALAVLRPGTHDELCALLRIASAHALPVYPISAGKNWGLGSRVPPRDAALVDLSRLSRIRDFDAELGHVTLEPGVSFQQLYDFLRTERAEWFVNTTGASPLASVVGNALERGDGTGPYGDRVHHVCNLRVALASGETLRTGFGRFGDSELAKLHRFGVGPALDGLFSQSNFGIVSELTLWLAPLPKSLSVVRCSVVEAARLAPLTDALRRLRLDGTLRSVAGIWNDYRVLSTRRQYPWELTQGRTPLARTQLEQLASEWGGARWFSTAALYAASAAQGAAHRAHVESVLAPLVDHLELTHRDGDALSGAELYTEPDPAFRFLQGIPHQGSLASTYFRKRTPPPAELDPDRDGCGVLWCCPTLPFRGRDLAAAADLAEQLLLEHGFEPLLAAVAQTERTLYFVPLIVYDRDVPGEDARALAAHDALLSACEVRGWLPYRLGIQSMSMLPPALDDTERVLARLKATLDPARVIAPGRYER